MSDFVPKRNRATDFLEAGLTNAALANWMIKQGCDCAAVRRASIAILNTKPMRDGFKNFDKIPGGTGPAEIASWILGNVGPSDENKGIWANLDNLSNRNLYRRIDDDCCAEKALGGTPSNPFDLYKREPSIGTLGINDKFLEID